MKNANIQGPDDWEFSTDLFLQKHKHTHTCSCHSVPHVCPHCSRYWAGHQEPCLCWGTATRAASFLTVRCFPDLETHSAHLCGGAWHTVHRWERGGNRWEVHWNRAAQMLVWKLWNAAVLQGAGNFLRSTVLPLTVSVGSLGEFTLCGSEKFTFVHLSGNLSLAFQNRFTAAYTQRTYM